MVKDKKQEVLMRAEKIRLGKLAEYVFKEYERRREERKPYEAEWKLNADYYEGRQYLGLTEDYETVSFDGGYDWQPKRVYNHIAPVIESKLAKLARVRPVINVSPVGDDAKDYESARICKKVLDSAYDRLSLNDVILKVTEYSEVFGTGFYKIIWNNDGGEKITKDGLEQEVPKTGDIEVRAVMPFSVYPDSLYNEDLKDCKSIIQSSVMSVKDIFGVYGKEVIAEKITPAFSKNGKKKTEDSALVLEYYEAPSAENKNGRMITVCGKEVLYEGELPFVNGDGEKRGIPFVKQISVKEVGKFFGSSVIKRLIPVQRAYNAVKNRKQEFLNRLSTGVLSVEDGSVDTDDLADNGLEPGRIIVYRQGSAKPEMMGETAMPPDFEKEEEKLLAEFSTISGVNDLSVDGISASAVSGTALELIFSQDNERMSLCAENLRKALLETYRQILRLFRQFATFVRKGEIKSKHGVEIFTFSGENLNTDKVEFASENELLYTPVQKKAMLLELYSSGLLNKENGLGDETRSKLLELLGYADLDDGRELKAMHADKAEAENLKLLTADVDTDIIDDDEIHIDRHVKYYLAEYEKAERDEALAERFKRHVAKHKQNIKEKKEN